MSLVNGRLTAVPVQMVTAMELVITGRGLTTTSCVLTVVPQGLLAVKVTV